MRNRNFQAELLYKRVEERLKTLREIVKDFCRINRIPIVSYPDLKDLLLQWHYEASFVAKERLCGRVTEPLDERYLSALDGDVSDVIRQFSLYGDSPWCLYFHEGFLEAACSLRDEDKHALVTDIVVLVFGYAGYLKRRRRLTSQMLPYIGMQAYVNQYNGQFVVYVSEVARYPEVDQDRIASFLYSQQWRLVGIAESLPYAEKLLDNYLASLSEHERIRPQDIPYHQSVGFSEEDAFNIQGKKVLPAINIAVSLTQEQSEQFLYDENKDMWVSLGRYNQEIATENTREALIASKINASLFQNLLTPDSRLAFAEMLKKIPAIRWQASNEELNAIVQPGNVMVIGRSGTGKTTCALLRILAMEWLFRLNYKRQKDNLLQDQDRDISIRNVFLTVSTYLCTEVRNFYYNMINSVKQQGVEIRVNEDFIKQEELQDWTKIDQDRGIAKFPAFLTPKSFLYFLDLTLASQDSSYFEHFREGEVFGLGYHEQREGVAYVFSPDRSSSKVMFEVTFDYFNLHWKNRLKACKCSPPVVWTEICSIIKGSPEAFKSNGYISKHEYMTLGKKKSVLSLQQREMIWKLFLEYEQWKEEESAYDFQDLVNHLLLHFHYSGYAGPQIHFVTIDEVQDCSIAALLLLCKVTQQNLFFAGDTAQTISEGIGFRFCDLESLFRDTNVIHSEVYTRHLNVNYRSHRRILDLGNSVVELIQSLFPETIDRLRPEVSVTDGCMPLLLGTADLGLLTAVVQRADRISGQRIDFGCGQVIIGRSKKSLDNIPELLGECMKLTVRQSKGLEFIDVIIYNFFHDSSLTEAEWSALFRFNKSRKGEFDKVKYAGLCYELKHLYVAITRAKERIIFYDETFGKREGIARHWLENGLVSLIQSYADVIEHHRHPSLRIDSPEAWLEQGRKMFQKKCYKQARQCFIAAGNEEWGQKAAAFDLAEEANKQMAKITELERSAKRVEFHDGPNRAKVQTLYREAGELFQSLHEYFEAARCFYSYGDKPQAGELFEHAGKLLEAGEVWKELGKYERAYSLFIQVPHISKSLECLVMFDYEGAVQFFHDHYGQLHREVVAKVSKELLVTCFSKVGRLIKKVPKVVVTHVEDVPPEMAESEQFVVEHSFKLNPNASEAFYEQNVGQRTDFQKYYREEEEVADTVEEAKQDFLVNYPHVSNGLERQFRTEQKQIVAEQRYNSHLNCVQWLFQFKNSTPFFEPRSFDSFLEFMNRVAYNPVAEQTGQSIESIVSPLIEAFHPIVSEFVPSDYEIKKHVKSQEEAYILENAWKGKHYDAFVGLCEVFGYQILVANRIGAIINRSRLAIKTRFPDLLQEDFLRVFQEKQELFDRNFASLLLSYMGNPNNSESTLHSYRRSVVLLGFWRSFLPLLGVQFCLNLYQHNAVYTLELQKEFPDALESVPLHVLISRSKNAFVKLALLEEAVLELNKFHNITMSYNQNDHTFQHDVRDKLVSCIPIECKCMYAFWQFVCYPAYAAGIRAAIDTCYEVLISSYKKNQTHTYELDSLKLKDAMAFLIHLIYSYSSNEHVASLLNNLKLFQREKVLFCVLIACKILKRGEDYRGDPKQYKLLESMFWSLGVKPVNPTISKDLPLITHGVCLVRSKLLNDQEGNIRPMSSCFSLDYKGEMFMAPLANMIAVLRTYLLEFSIEYIGQCQRATQQVFRIYFLRSSLNENMKKLKDSANKLGCQFLFCRIAACLGYAVNDNIFFGVRRSFQGLDVRLNALKCYKTVVLGKQEFVFEKIALTYWSREAILHAAIRQLKSAEMNWHFLEIYYAYATIEARVEFLKLAENFPNRFRNVEAVQVARMDIAIQHGDLMTAISNLRHLVEGSKGSPRASVRCAQYIQRAICYYLKGYYWRGGDYKTTVVYLPISMYDFYRTYYPKCVKRYSRIIITSNLKTLDHLMNLAERLLPRIDRLFHGDLLISSLLLLAIHVHPFTIPNETIEQLKFVASARRALNMSKRLRQLIPEELQDSSSFFRFIFGHNYKTDSSITKRIEFDPTSFKQKHQIKQKSREANRGTLFFRRWPDARLQDLRKLYLQLVQLVPTSKENTWIFSDFYELSKHFNQPDFNETCLSIKKRLESITHSS